MTGVASIIRETYTSTNRDITSFKPSRNLAYSVEELVCSSTKSIQKDRKSIDQRDLRVIARLAARVWLLVKNNAPDKFNLSSDQLVKLTKREINRRWEPILSIEERQSLHIVRSQPQASEATKFHHGWRIRKSQVPVYEVIKKQRMLPNLTQTKKGRYGTRMMRTAKFSRYTTLFMHTALSNWNMCDGSVHTLLPLLRSIFTGIDPSARVEWLVVRTRPRFILVLKDETIEDVSHSVIRITTGGRTVILDPSGAQHGNRHSYHPQKWDDYKRDWIIRDYSWNGLKYTTDTTGYEQEASQHANRAPYWTYISLELVNEYQKFAMSSDNQWWLDMWERQRFLESVDVAIRNAKAWC